MKLLIVEDDAKTALALKKGLSREGFEVRSTQGGSEGWELLRSDHFDLLVLDWMLPGRDGLDILAGIRRRGLRLPVLLLTAKDAIEDRVMGLDAGADDYLVKPFAFAELLARIRALLRRQPSEQTRFKSVGDLRLEWESRRVRRGEVELVLTPREFDILAYLIRNRGQVVTRQMLACEVWRVENRATPLDNVIDVHLAHLRKKVDGGHATRLIHTVRGVGFILREGADE